MVSSYTEFEVSDTATAFEGGDGHRQFSHLTKGSSWALELGVEKVLNVTNKLEPYIGGYIFAGGVREEEKMDVLKDNTNTGWKTGDYEYVFSRGSKASIIGVAGVAGFNYFMVENLAIGAEFSYGWSNYTWKGGEVTIEAKEGATTIEETYTRSDDYKIKESEFGAHGAKVTLSWFF